MFVWPPVAVPQDAGGNEELLRVDVYQPIMLCLLGLYIIWFLLSLSFWLFLSFLGVYHQTGGYIMEGTGITRRAKQLTGSQSTSLRQRRWWLAPFSLSFSQARFSLLLFFKFKLLSCLTTLLFFIIYNSRMHLLACPLHPNERLLPPSFNNIPSVPVVVYCATGSLFHVSPSIFLCLENWGRLEPSSITSSTAFHINGFCRSWAEHEVIFLDADGGMSLA